MPHASQGSGCSPLPAAQTSPDPFRTLVRALVRRPGDYESMGCLPMCLCVCLYICLYVSLIVLLCLWLAMHVYMCLCLYVSACVFPCVCVSVCVIVGGLYVCVTMCLRIHLCAYAYVNVQMWSITWADPWRERLTGRCVHSSLPLGLIVLS